MNHRPNESPLQPSALGTDEIRRADRHPHGSDPTRLTSGTRACRSNPGGAGEGLGGICDINFAAWAHASSP